MERFISFSLSTSAFAVQRLTKISHYDMYLHDGRLPVIKPTFLFISQFVMRYTTLLRGIQFTTLVYRQQVTFNVTTMSDKRVVNLEIKISRNISTLQGMRRFISDYTACGFWLLCLQLRSFATQFPSPSDLCFH